MTNFKKKKLDPLGFFRVFYLVLAVGVILVLAYILGGYAFLVKGVWGTDMGSALSTAAWIDKYFPRVPFWFPLAGGGISITHSYPVFSFYLVALLKRLTSLDLVQIFRFLGFFSVPLMALGIYAFVALRLRNQTMALIASILYLLSPIAWVWLFDWGFYAESVSHMFVMPTIIFWDLFFTSFLDSAERIRTRVYLALAVIFLSLALLTHFHTGLGLIMLFGFYVIGYTVRAKERKKILVRGVLAFFLVGLLTLGITAFITLPFYRYTKIAAQAGVGGRSYEYFKESKMTVGHILGFRSLTEEYIAARHISFPAVVSILAVLGIFLSLRKARTFTLALFLITAVALFFNPDFLFWISRHTPRLFTEAFNRRPALVLLRFILPTLAALGAINIFKASFFWVKGRLGRLVKGVFASLAGLGLVVLALYWFGRVPRLGRPSFSYGSQGVDLRNVWGISKSFCFQDEREEVCYDFKTDDCQVGLGDEKWCHSSLSSFFLPLGVRSWCEQAEKRGLTLPELCYPERLTDTAVRSFWQQCQEDESFSGLCGLRFESLEEQLSLANWPKIKITKTLYDPVGKLEQLEQNLNRISGENPLARLDFSTYLGQFGMLAPYYNRDRSFSQVHIYTAGSTLIRQFWAQQMAVFYFNNPFYGKDPSLINNLARWFGINYVFFNEYTDSRLFREGGWELWDGDWREGVLKFPEENSLADLTKRPAVLVIGQDKVGAYNQVFDLASYGVFPYDDYLVVWGKGLVDDYNLKELGNFDLLLLHGYTYENYQKVNKLLADYLQGGGRIFVDTGWQYTTPDWQTGEEKEVMKILPFKKLLWKDLGKTSAFVLEGEEFGEGVDVSQFAPLVYQDQPWGVSSGERSNLRDWAKVVLSVKDQPLVVSGELGEGRVIWSGMNLFPHAKQKERIYYEELDLLTNLFSWLAEGVSKESFSVAYQREHPDKIEFTVEEEVPEGGLLLWKEAYYPDFQAKLETGNKRQTTSLDVYRAGPGFTLIKVPELRKGDKIAYQYRQPLSEKVFFCLSLLTLLFLSGIVIEGAFIKKERSVLLRLAQVVEKRLHYLLFNLWKKPISWWRKEEEEY